MHKKLIFLHLGKCGGSTVMANPARSDRVQLFSYNRSSLSLTDEEVLEGSLDADIIHIHGVQGLRSRFSDEQWRRLLDQSIRLCFVREPIQKYLITDLLFKKSCSINFLSFQILTFAKSKICLEIGED